MADMQTQTKGGKQVTVSEHKTIKQALKPLAEFGAISAATMDELSRLVGTSGNTRVLPELMTRRQVAGVLGTCPRTIRNYQLAGALPPIKLANRRLIRYKREDVESLLDKSAASE